MNIKYLYHINKKYLYQKTNGVLFQFSKKPGEYKSFNYSNYATKAQAFQEAKKYRDKFLKARGLLHYLKTKTVRTKNSRNKSGINGVTLIIKKSKGISYSSYCAYFYKDGKQVPKCFSINRYGREKAFVMACKERYKAEKTLFINDPKKLPIRLNLMQKHFPNIRFDKEK